jgi:hypothetical protein
VANTPDRSPGRSNTQTVVVVVAIVGLLASVVSAWLGGYWANRSVEREIESQRSAEIKDQRRDIYVEYLRLATQACEIRGTLDDVKINHAVDELLTQQGLVLLIAGSNTPRGRGPSLEDAVTEFTDAIGDMQGHVCDNADAFKPVRDRFVQAARQDLE